jgi:Uncharacterised nucleotidyltransferase
MPTVDVSQISHQVFTLLRCLRREGDRVDWPSGEADWQPFAKVCECHQVTPFVFFHLNKTANAVPAGLLEYLRTRYFEISARNYRLAKEAVELTLFLQERDIPAVAFKGPVAAMAAYGDLALRQYQDIDLVVRRVDLLKAVALLVDRGFRIAPESCAPDNPRRVSRTHEVTLAAPDKSYFVDLHWRLASELEGAFCPDVELMRDRLETVHLPQGKVFTFCREDLFVALCCHGAKHRWGRLKWLLDIAEILRSPVDLNWNRIETITSERPLARASTSLAIFLAHDLLNAPMPAVLPNALEATARTRSVAEGIRAEIFTYGRTPGIDHNHTTLPELEGSIPAWIQYLWARYPKWFFEHAIVRIDAKDRALISLPRHLDFLYYIIRPIRLVGKHSIRVARLAEHSTRR